MKYFFVLLSFCTVSFLTQPVWAQPTNVIDYSKPQNYEIGGIEVVGAQYSDPRTIAALSSLSVGQTIKVPGPDIPRAMQNLWKLRLFTEIDIQAKQRIDNVLYLEIRVTEKPRLARKSFLGVKKGVAEELDKEVSRFATRGSIVTENVLKNTELALKTYFSEKGYPNTKISVVQRPDTLLNNAVMLEYTIDKGEKMRIADIEITGNSVLSDSKIRKMLKETKRIAHLFKKSKYIKADYEKDKEAVIAKYNELGYKDAQILSDSVWTRDGRYMLRLNLLEGNKYYYGNIVFKGNSVYPTNTLREVLNVNKGDIYNSRQLDSRLNYSPDSRDISSLYMDNGYLFFRVDPVETGIHNDTINLEIRITEGPQATIDRVVIKGNDRTNEHVVRRELRTKPGQKFSRSDIIRSQREIVNLGYFNPEKMGINTPVDAQRGTVDIEYELEEKPSDQLELSAGWGGVGRGIVGTLGVTFNNFSLRGLVNGNDWNPVPQGDGQRLSLRAQTNGRFYQSFNMSFTEPWLGGKKPNSLNVGAYYTRQSNGLSSEFISGKYISLIGGSIGFGTRLKKPDDFFVATTSLNLQNITLRNYGSFTLENGITLQQGTYNNFSISQVLSRNSISDPIFPTSGSRITLTAQFTLPYSLFRKDNFWALSDAEKAGLTETQILNFEAQRRFHWVEYHKWRFDAEWFTPVIGKLVLRSSAKLGLLGTYDKEIGLSPFERYVLGGDGLQNFSAIEARELFALRGYNVEDLAANTAGAGAFNKFTLELRYPISLNPTATIYALGFLEGGNAWRRLKEINPFELRRSAGLGLRAFLPMFGTLGFDYGIGFDKDSAEKFGDYGRFSVILGFEPQ